MFFMQFTLSDNRKPFFCGKKKVKFFLEKKENNIQFKKGLRISFFMGKIRVQLVNFSLSVIMCLEIRI